MSEEKLFNLKEEKIPPYSSLTCLNDKQIDVLKDIFNGVINSIKNISNSKLIALVKPLPVLCRLHYLSIENKTKQRNNDENHHPIQPIRGEIYNTLITENIGSELNGNHLVVVVSNSQTNIFAEKINVIPIEGDGTRVPKYLVQLNNEDLDDGHLDKEPSRIIIPEILTIDKARLQNRIGKIKADKMKIINDKLKRQLAI
jgi:mRNA-degrading endonuclease toxin of MazEF toxin-antitoxin module